VAENVEINVTANASSLGTAAADIERLDAALALLGSRSSAGAAVAATLGEIASGAVTATGFLEEFLATAESGSAGAASALRSLITQVEAYVGAQEAAAVAQQAANGEAATAYERVVLGAGAAVQATEAQTAAVTLLTAANAELAKVEAQVSIERERAAAKASIAAAPNIGTNVAGNAVGSAAGIGGFVAGQDSRLKDAEARAIQLLNERGVADAQLILYTTALGKAALAAVATEEAFVDIQSKDNAATQTLIRSKSAAVAAQDKLNILAAEDVSSGGRGRGGGNFSGLSDSSGGSFLGQLGTTFKYIAFYQVFQLLLTTFKDSVEASANYDRAVTNLGIALAGTDVDAGNLANSLGQIGTRAGIAASEAVAAGTQYRRAFPSADPTQAALAGASTISTLAVIGDPKTAQANSADVLAVLANYNLGIEGTTRVLDAATAAAQAFGLSGPNDVLPGLAQISDVGAAQGFSPEELAATVATIVQRTSETSQAAAGELQRFLGREGGNAVQQVFASFGVDTTKKFADELRQFEPIFEQLTAAQQQAVVSELGGGRAAPAVQAVLDTYKQIEQVATADNAGKAQEQEIARLADLKGLLTQIGGDFQELYKDIGSSGIGVIFGVALQELDPLLKGVDDLLQLWNEMPGPIKQITAAVVELSVALALLGKGEGVGLLGSIGAGGSKVLGKLGLGGLLGGGGEAAGLAGAAGGDLSTVIGTSEIGAATGGLEGVAAGGGAVATLVPYIAPAIVGLIALGAWKDINDKTNKAIADAGTAKQLDSADSAAAYKDLASKFATAKTEVPTGFVTSLFGKGVENDQLIADLDKLQKFAEAQSKAYSDAAAARGTGTAFTNNGEVDFQGLFTSLHGSGQSSAEMLKQLTDAIFGLGGAAGTTAQRLVNDKGTIDALARGATATGFDKLFNERLPIPGGPVVAFDGIGNPAIPGSQSVQSPSLNDQNSQAQKLFEAGVNESITKAASTLPAGAPLNASTIAAMKAAADKFAESTFPKAQLPTAIKTINDNIDKTYATLQAGLAALASGKGISDTQLASLFGGGGYVQAVQDTISGIGSLTNFVEQTRQGNQLLLTAQHALQIALASGKAADIDQARAGLALAQAQVDQQAVSNAQQLIAHIKATQGNTARARAAIVQVERQLVGTLAGNQDVNGLIAAFANMDKATIASVVRSAEAAVQAAKAADDAAKDIIAKSAEAAQLAANYAAGFGVAPATAAANTPGAKAADKAYNDALARLAAIKTAAGVASPSGSDLKFPKPSGGGDTAAQIAAAKASAAAIAGDAISEAQAAVRAAQINLGAAKKGSVEFYNDLKALHDAQYQLATAEQTLANQALALRGDVTDPLVQARDKVIADRNKLAYDRARGANTTADALQLKQDQAAQEKTAFEQKFSDEQTAYQLNQISYQSYINYLEAQHNLLTAVHKKTRDQIDELNQVDSALQAAQQQLSGQFNIGAIQLPTIYEVRRSIAATAAGTTYQGSTQNTIYITGTDTAAVKKVIQDVLGPTASQTRTVAGRK
jgi:hypothetical protein